MPYFIIKPNADLQTLLSQTSEMSLPPRLVKVDPLPSGLTDSEAMESQKLLHLAGMADYTSLLANPDALYSVADNEKRQRKYQFMKTLLGDPPYTRALFDRWWTIERINAMTLYEDILKRIPVMALEMVQEIESEAIASTLKKIIETKSKGRK